MLNHSCCVWLCGSVSSQEISNLHKAIGAMTAPEAKKWMKMCVAAGLWVAQNPHEFSDSDSDEEEEGGGGEERGGGVGRLAVAC